MKKQYIRIITLCVVFLSFSSIMNAFAKEHYWYCKRNSEHKQPTLDENFSYIKDYGGFYVDERYTDKCAEKMIYLTFDAGYENGNVAKILDTMREEGVVGSFFVS